jgi:hypothetical protein
MPVHLRSPLSSCGSLSDFTFARPLPTVAPTRVPTVYSLRPGAAPQAQRDAEEVNLFVETVQPRRPPSRAARAQVGPEQIAEVVARSTGIPVSRLTQTEREKVLTLVDRLQQQVDPPPPPARTEWTRRVPHPVLIGHAASLTPY